MIVPPQPGAIFGPPGSARAILHALAGITQRPLRGEADLSATVFAAITTQLMVRTVFVVLVQGDQFVIGVMRDRLGGIIESGHTYPRSDAMVNTVFGSNSPLVLDDATQHSIFSRIVTQGRTIGAYIGVPIRGSAGQMVGTLCGMDTEICTFSSEQVEFMQVLAALAAPLLERSGSTPARRSTTGELAQSTLLTPTPSQRAGTGGKNTVLIFDRTVRGRRPLATVLQALGFSVNDVLQRLSLEVIQQQAQLFKPSLIVVVGTDLDANYLNIMQEYTRIPQHVPVIYMGQGPGQREAALKAGAVLYLPYDTDPWQYQTEFRTFGRSTA